MPPLVEVLLPRPIAHPFHYLVPESLQAQARPGVRAVVPFGHELLTGVIVQTAATPPSHTKGKLRALHGLLDDAPLLSPEVMELLRRTADYYAVPWGELLRSALPSPLLPSGKRRFRYRAGCAPPSLRSPATRQLFELLRKQSRGLSQQTLLQRMKPARPSNVMATLRRLISTGCITEEWKLNPLKPLNIPKISLYKPTSSDKIGINKIELSYFKEVAKQEVIDSININVFSVLVGQNQSGCADHYLAAARRILQAGRSVLLLAPEVARAAQLAAMLQEGLGRSVLHLHADPAPRKRARQWLALRDAAGPCIVVGSRSALFAPVPSLGLIIVDEEADALYKQEERPRLHARDVAILRAQQERIPILLGGRFISVESYAHGQSGKYRWITPDEPVRFNRDTAVRLIDVRSEWVGDGLLTKPLIELINDRLERGEQTLLFVNRRGYASGLICRDCGGVVRCPTCRTALGYRKTETTLQCRYCHFRMAAPTVCPGCQGQRLGPFGTGTQRVEEALRRQWPARRLLRIDRDAPQASDGHTSSEEETAELLIGTQLCLHRPPPPRLSLIAVLDAELDLSRPDFRAEERALQLLIRLQGLLRPALANATLLLQSRQPERPALQALAANAPAKFYDDELAQRKTLGYPPFTRLATVHGRGQSERPAQQIRAAVQAAQAQGEVWGPIPVSKPRRGKPEWELLLKAPTPSALRRIVAAVKALPPALRLERQGALQIEIDPA